MMQGRKKWICVIKTYEKHHEVQIHSILWAGHRRKNVCIDALNFPVVLITCMDIPAVFVFLFIFFFKSAVLNAFTGLKIRQSAILKMYECPRIGKWMNLCNLIIFPDIFDWVAYVWYCHGFEGKELYCFTLVCLCVCLFVTNLRSHCHVIKSSVKHLGLLRRFYHVPPRFKFRWFPNIVVYYLYYRLKKANHLEL